VFKIEPIQ